MTTHYTNCVSPSSLYKFHSYIKSLVLTTLRIAVRLRLSSACDNSIEATKTPLKAPQSSYVNVQVSVEFICTLISLKGSDVLI
jgi:hypothetical protein